MRVQELQARVKPIINAVMQGRPVEDTRVEVKSAWIEALQAARRLAGHANAASGEPIIWIFGIDEKAKEVIGVETLEMDNWIKSLEKHFDGAAPALVTHTNIHLQNKTVVVLYFETHHAAPFIIKNPKGGYPEFEVPWRSGTRLRAAKRVEILQILLPNLRIPRVDVLSAELSLAVQQGAYGTAYQNANKRLFLWTITADLYITTQTQGRIVIPHRNCSAKFGVADFAGEYNLPVTFKPLGKSSTIVCSATEIIVVGPGSVRLEASGTTEGYSPNQYKLPEGQAGIRIEMQPANTNKRTVNKMALKYIEKSTFSSIFSSGSQWST